MHKRSTKQISAFFTNPFRVCGVATSLCLLVSCNHSTLPPALNDPPQKKRAVNSVGERGFSQPQSIPITLANLPKLVRAGKPITRKDPSNGGYPFFTNFGTDQGLPLSSLLCSATDAAGNLWFGTAGAGATRYDGKNFTTYTTAQGMAGNVVFYILEDKNANIWFATTAGVSKYDGNSFSTYTTAQGLAGNYVVCIMQDRRGDIWFGTHDGGVSRYDGKNFTNYATGSGLADNYVQCMREDRNGSLWFGTNAGGVSNYDGRHFTNFSRAGGLPANSVKSIMQDRTGTLWFGTTAGVSKFDGATFSNYSTVNGLANNYITSILQDATGNIWFGMPAGGISKYDGSKFINFATSPGLSGFVTSILQDKGGNLWITSNGDGLIKYEDPGFTNYTKAQGIAGDLVFGIEQDKEGSLWFGTFEEGVSKYDGRNFTNYSTAQGLINNLVWCILADKKGNIWFGTDGGVSKFDGANFTNYTTAQGLLSNTVISMMEDRAGNIWFGTRSSGASKFDGSGFTNYTTAQGLAGNNIWRILQDGPGNIWFATHGSGASKYDGKTFTTYTTEQGLLTNTLSTIISGKNGDLWFGTSGKGISKYNGKTFTNYTVEQGLSDNNVWSMVEDTKRNILWIATNKGLSGLGDSSVHDASGIQSVGNGIPPGNFETFSKNTGFPIKDGSAGSLLLDKDGILWMGSVENRLIRFDYSLVNKKNTEKMPLEIQAVKVNNQNICWNNLLYRQPGHGAPDSLVLLNEMVSSFGKAFSPKMLDSMGKRYAAIRLDAVRSFYPVPVGLILPHAWNNITIDFAAIEPAMPRQVRYQYKLEGYTNDWSPLSNSSSAVFGNIDPGDYTFRVKALSPAGEWSETTYAFRVLPPWWTTWWAYALYGLTIGALLYMLFRLRFLSLERTQARQIHIMVATQEEERRRISRDLHDDIGTKLSTLKLFLSSLREKAVIADNEEIRSLAEGSEQFVIDAMQDIRRLLSDLSPVMVEEFGYAVSVEILINKINEMDKVHFNLQLFGMERRLTGKYELALYRITQELINNVLKHAGAKTVFLQIGRRDEKIILMIEDDGKGFDVNAHGAGYGLQNLRARTKLMHGMMVIDSAPFKGTSVLIEIPYNEIPKNRNDA